MSSWESAGLLLCQLWNRLKKINTEPIPLTLVCEMKAVKMNFEVSREVILYSLGQCRYPLAINLIMATSTQVG